jgi:hypothetical protein
VDVRTPRYKHELATPINIADYQQARKFKSNLNTAQDVCSIVRTSSQTPEV